MSNSYYNHTTYPTPNSPGSSASLRNELENIGAGFDLLPTLAANGYKVAMVNSAGTALIASSALQSLAITSSTINSTTIGGTTAAAGTFTSLTATGAVSLGTSVTLTGGTINNMVIGGTTPAAGSFTTVSASSGFTGNLTGNVTGNVTGTAANVTGTVAIANGGTGQTTATAAFNALAPVTTAGDLIIGNGTNSSTRLAIGSNSYVLTSNGTTASWAAPGAAMTYPGAGIGNSTGSAWGTSYTTTGTGTVLALATSPTFVTPVLGTPTSGNFSTGTFTWPTFNQNTTGTASNVTGTVAIANGGTGQTTASAAFNALSPVTTAGDLIIGNGTNSATRLGIGANTYVLTSNGTTASWASPGAASMIYPGAGIANSTGSAWGTSYTTTGTGTVLALATSPTFVTPVLGTPTSGDFSTGTFTWPTFNQNTTGTASNVTSTVAVGNGGTGQTTAGAAFNALSPITTAGDLIIGNGTNSATRLGIGANTYILTSNGTTASWAAPASGMTYPGAGIANSTGTAWGTSYTTTGTGTVLALATSPTFVTPVLGTPTSGNFSTGTFTWPTFNQNTTGTAANVTGVVTASTGGTGQSSYTLGDILYASSGSALSKLADVATGNALISGGIGGAPSYGKIGLTTHISGTLAVANGGTGLTSGTSGGVLYYSATGTLASSAALTASTLLIGGGAGAAPTTTTTATGALTFLGTPSSANLAALLTDETGTGANVFATAPTLTNPTVTNYVETPYTATISAGAITLDLSNGTVQFITFGAANATITMPTAVSGKSFTLFLKQDSVGSRAATWTTVSWPSAIAPTLTSTANKLDKFVFTSDGTSWFGSTAGQNYT
jgi:hypothetical protein